MSTPAITPTPVTVDPTVATGNDSTPKTPKEVRQELYEKSYASQGITPQDQPVGNDGAPAASATPSPEGSQDSAAPGPLSPEPGAELAALKEQLAALATQLQELKKPPATPAPADAKPADASPRKTFIDFLKENDLEGAEDAIAKRVMELRGKQLREESVEMAVARTRTDLEAERFVSELREANKDLLPMESWVTAESQRLYQSAVDAGKVRDFTTHLTEYKAALNTAVANVRKALQQVRAAGKDEAMTIRKEVVSSPTIAPQQVAPLEGREDASSKPKPYEGQTSFDYLAKRNERLAKIKGLGPMPS